MVGDRPTGVRPVAEVVTTVDAGSVSRWVGAGLLVRPLPGVLALPAAAGTWRGRARPADPRTAARPPLDRAGVVGPGGPAGRDRPPGPGRCLGRGVRARRLPGGGTGGQGGGDRCGTPPGGVGGRRDASWVGTHPAGRRALGKMLDLVGGGSHSEFEIWGPTNVVDVPGVPAVPWRRHDWRSSWTGPPTTGHPTHANVICAATLPCSPRGGPRCGSATAGRTRNRRCAGRRSPPPPRPPTEVSPARFLGVPTTGCAGSVPSS
ncbi:MAG: hypothetical protein JWQ53_1402 [Klenkia sp.]|nr:hypothetical protein [Klenkia sp.]